MKVKAFGLILAFFIIIGTVAMTSCGMVGSRTFTVGICQFEHHDALDEATRGFKDALVLSLGEENIVFEEQNAEGNTNACSEIVGRFASDKVDLIMANATPALVAAFNLKTKISILGTSVTEYGTALRLEDFDGIVGGNVSGTSDLAPLNHQAQMIIDLVPTAKRVGILYCPSEANSQYQVNVVKKFLGEKGMTVAEFPFYSAGDVSAVTKRAAEICDALYIPTDNIAAACGETIGKIVTEAGIPVIAGEEGICRACGIATLTIDYYQLGVKTGEMAARALRGEADIKKMPVEYAPATKKYNPVMCQRLGIAVPEYYVAIKF